MITTDLNTIAVHNLKIGYKNNTIANEITFSLQPGELCAIIGVNGIGKSTLLRTLGNIQNKLGGIIKIQNKELEKYSPIEVAKQMSLVLTENIASKNLTVKELITLGRQPYTNWMGSLSKADSEFIDECIAALELEPFINRKCHEISDGQLQRVLIARAQAQDTPLILLDEPTTHLDLYHKVQILKLLKQLVQEQQKTIVFTTHEIDLAIQLADKILIIDGIENPFNEPCELISSGAFEKLFPTDMVTFDANSGSFKVNK
ncbi:ABC transporter ATP-binding protein [Croceitalea vernalis]|uniref:ABC transporter ATP-binding protein n=1 Tax=Croceitalea vernalis TaxID=3075599 RepID=A0ABU3BI77_9FLAO|nr:ABC transporter ATP-binding protein [Croceitalea sp. P007]MDT0621875.1 ABC transporter ATP-binding protein [Croceitalea sp. P007]